MKAVKTLSTISREDILWKQQLDREIALRDYNSGISYARSKGFSDGVSKGVDKRQKEIAASMKKDGINIDKISLYTGLSEDEIKAL